MNTYATRPLTFGAPSDMSKLAGNDNTELHLHGVHHSARPTWKLGETVRFYRDILGLPLVHCITARGWGRQGHPDFLHFFFDAGRDSLIAFFYYLGTQPPSDLRPDDEVFFRATHISWRVETRDELLGWKETLESRGVDVSPVSRHEIIESIYFADPNGYPLEVSFQLRELDGRDARDAELSLRAAAELEAEGAQRGESIRGIEEHWLRKANLLAGGSGAADQEGRGIEFFVLDVPEFSSLVHAARANPDCQVQNIGNGFFRVRSEVPITFNRRQLGLKPAVWYGLFTGGLRGRIAEFGREEVRLVPEADDTAGA